MIQTQIYQALVASSDVQSIVSGRIYPIRLPQDSEIPALVYHVPDITPVVSLSGDSGTDQNRVVVTAWAKDYTTAHELAGAARAALTIDSGLRIVTESQNDSEDPDTHSFCVVSTFNIWSAFNAGAPGSTIDPIYEFDKYPFEGDGVTTTFIFDDKTYRENSLVLFINGRLAEKNVEYTERPGRDGVEFITAPAGDPFKDKMLAYFVKP